MPASTEAIPALPEGVESLAAHVEAPSELARRLAQIGVVAKERGAELVSQLKTGQRLVSPKATSGAGTDLSPRRMRRPARRGVSPNAPGWSISKTSLSRPASMPPPSVRRWKPPRPS